jgi:hypothetical protein
VREVSPVGAEGEKQRRGGQQHQPCANVHQRAMSGSQMIVIRVRMIPLMGAGQGSAAGR